MSECKCRFMKIYASESGCLEIRLSVAHAELGKVGFYFGRVIDFASNVLDKTDWI